MLSASLVSEEPEAWQHGTVFPAVYRAFRKFGSGAITAKATNGFGQIVGAALSTEQRDVVKSVVEFYGRIHAFSLPNITHQAGSPWASTYQLGMSARIPNRVIAAHY